jgi:nicotinate-nucleotide adenylyltransferase
LKHIGLFGGTFDPVGRAHVKIAEAALATGTLDSLVVMPCSVSPHKTPRPPWVSDYHRLQMSKIAFAGLPGIEISSFEIDRKQISYTKTTLEYLWERFPESRIVLVIGTDEYRVLDTWVDFLSWGSKVDFMVVRRKDMIPQKPFVTGHSPVTFVDANITTFRATKIREGIVRGFDMSDHLPPGVSDYITEHGLYQTRPLRTRSTEALPSDSPHAGFSKESPIFKTRFPMINRQTPIAIKRHLGAVWNRLKGEGRGKTQGGAPKI